MTVKKRFIAGAVCPRCSVMDRLVVYREGEKEFRECVECGFKDEMRFKPVQRELPTRVSAPEAQAEAQVIRIFDVPPEPSKKGPGD